MVFRSNLVQIAICSQEDRKLFKSSRTISGISVGRNVTYISRNPQKRLRSWETLRTRTKARTKAPFEDLKNVSGMQEIFYREPKISKMFPQGPQKHWPRTKDSGKWWIISRHPIHKPKEHLRWHLSLSGNRFKSQKRFPNNSNLSCTFLASSIVQEPVEHNKYFRKPFHGTHTAVQESLESGIFMISETF